MLKKLMKHEMRATVRIMLPLSALTLLLAISGNLSTYLLDRAQQWYVDMFALIMLMLFIVALVAICVMAVVIVIQRFYRNLLCDEGYIMFTLPCSVHQQVLSKLLVACLWSVVTVLVVVVACLTLADSYRWIEAALMGLKELVASMPQGWALVHSVGYSLELLLLAVLGEMSFCLPVYLALALGNGLSSKNKFIASVGIYCGIKLALQVLGVLLIMLLTWVGQPMLDSLSLFFESTVVKLLQENEWASLHIVFLGGIVALAVYCGAFYLATVKVLQKKLNLA